MKESIQFIILATIYILPMFTWFFGMRPFIKKQNKNTALITAPSAFWEDFTTVGRICKEQNIKRPISYWVFIFCFIFWIPGIYTAFYI